MMERELLIQAPLEHPCYAGHFPGGAVVPGVVLLELVVEALGSGAPRRLDQVKFHRALLPGDTFIVRHEVAGARLTFRCERPALHARAGERIAEGVLSVGSAG